VIRVLICDDNPIVRQGLVAVLSTFEELEVAGEAADGRQAVGEFQRLRPDVVLLDVRMPGWDGLTTLAALGPKARVLMLTYSDDEATVAAALRGGASGFLVHGEQQPEELADAVRAVAGGGTVLGSTGSAAAVAALRATPQRTDVAAEFGLTRREAELVEQLVGGRTNAEIAAALHLTVKTVKNHLHNAYAKLGVRSRAEAVALWLNGPGGREQGDPPTDGPARHG
jgi:DNA-binding NarL/FixJ family response regulator